MAKEMHDILARIHAANEAAKRACFNQCPCNIRDLRSAYDAGTGSERRPILRELKKSAEAMWKRGDWPSALGIGVVALNVESRHVPGSDAAAVLRENRRIH